MAYKDSGEIATNSNYTLGDYSFRIERSSVPGSTNDKIEAICTDKDGKNARKSIQIASTTNTLGWYVEANDTEASVYARLKIKAETLVPVPIPQSTEMTCIVWGQVWSEIASPYDILTAWIYSDTQESDSYLPLKASTVSRGGFNEQHFTHNGKTVYYTENGHGFVRGTVTDLSPNFEEHASYLNAYIAWSMIYGELEDKEEDVLIARFAIDLEDAGGVGPGSDWVDPGDYDPDWEEGDPTHTLYVTVTGALSGRHNDPIVDPSYSYIPADKDTVKDYGCGGDGGNGGGGGAGASTVVIHKFATNQANSKEVTAIARRHGYGSGGGKGGKGGDGCILVYY